MSERRYVVDRAVVWAPGFYRYTRITRERARHWLEHEREHFADFVGDAETRRHIDTDLGRDLGLHQFQGAPPEELPAVALHPVDVALVVRRRPCKTVPEDAPPGAQPDTGRGEWEYGLLTALDPEKHGPGL